MPNPLTDPGNAAHKFPPDTLAGNKTSAFNDPVQTNDWSDLDTANEVQPGLKPGQGWVDRPGTDTGGS